MRLLHVITALGVGGAENMLLKLLSARALEHVDQRVIAMLPGGAMEAPMRATGATVDVLDFLGGVPVVEGAVRLVVGARRADPDIIQGWMYHGNLGATLARLSSSRRPPLVWGIRQSLSSLAGENAFAQAGIHLNKYLSRAPDCILVNSMTSLEQHRAYGFDIRRARHLPNGFDTDRFRRSADARRELRASWGAADTDFVFGMLARFHPAKGHEDFLSAAGISMRTRPGLRFVLAGTGVTADNTVLSRAIAENGLDGRVHLLGEQRDVVPALSSMDCYVSSSSRIEAFSNSVGEAMSCELPCIVTAVGDSAQLVGDAGVVVSPQDPEALAAAMVAMVDLGVHARDALGARGRKRVETSYGIESVAQRYADLYRDLVAAKRRGS